jgi:probable rRNA maturation factor
MTTNPSSEVDVEIESEAWTLALPSAEALVRQAAGAALSAGRRGGVVILLTDDETVRDLNGRFRGRPVETNVLSFPAAGLPLGDQDPAEVFLGDMALAFGVCEREARAQGKSLADHLRHLVTHGLLHLQGHDHEDDGEAEVMEALERRLLATLGVADPYRPCAAPEVALEALGDV